jgi:hypothetical protein
MPGDWNVWVRSVDGEQTNNVKVQVGRTTKPLNPLAGKEDMIQKVKGAAILNAGTLIFNNPIVNRIGSYTGKRNVERQIKNIGIGYNLVKNVGTGAVVGGAAGAVAGALYTGYQALAGNADYLNDIRKTDVKAAYKLENFNGVQIGNRYRRNF